MINKRQASELRPFSGLTPEVVLDAATAFGLEPDGRLFALNSYENRVYQLGAGECQLVLKFYRPGRWSDAQIAEEHRFSAELAAVELPVAAPLSIGGVSLLRYRDFRLAAFRWMHGRAPDDRRATPRLGGARTGARERAVARGAARALLLGERCAARAGDCGVRSRRAAAAHPPAWRLPSRQPTVG